MTIHHILSASFNKDDGLPVAKEKIFLKKNTKLLIKYKYEGKFNFHRRHFVIHENENIFKK